MRMLLPAIMLIILLPMASAQPCNTAADADCNGQVSMAELTNYINVWYSCSSCASNLLGAINAFYSSGAAAFFFEDFTDMGGVAAMDNVTHTGSVVYPTGSSTGREPVPDSGTIGLWHLNGGAEDSSGNGITGTISGNVNCSAGGKYGRGCAFDGDHDSIDLGESDAIEGGTALTISAWVRLSDQDNAAHEVAFASQGIWLRRHAGTTSIYFVLRNSTGSLASAMAPGLFDDTGWHHIAGVYDGSQLQVYGDGIALDSTPPAISGPIESGTSNMRIGGDQTGIYSWNGTIDEVVVWRRALSAQEIRDLFEGRVTSGSLQSRVITTGGNYNTVKAQWSADRSYGIDVKIGDGTEWCSIGNGGTLTSYLSTCSALAPLDSFVYRVDFTSAVNLDSIRFDWSSITCTDGDADGYHAEGADCGPADCQDADPGVSPGAAEICGNGVDENCNGLSDDPCLPCAQLGGSYCTSTQICQGGSFASSAEGSLCCIGGTCAVPAISKQEIIDAIAKASHAYWEQRVVINRSGEILYGYSGGQTVVDPANVTDRWYESDASFIPEPHIFMENEDTYGHAGVAYGYIKAYEATGDKFLLRAAKRLGDTLLAAQQDIGCGGWWHDMGVIGYDRIEGSPTFRQDKDFGKFMNLFAWGGHGNVQYDPDFYGDGKAFDTRDICDFDGASSTPALYLLRLYQIMPADDPDRERYLQGAKWLADAIVGFKYVTDVDLGFKPYGSGGIPQMWPYNTIKDRIGIDAGRYYPYNISHNAMVTLNDDAMPGAMFYLMEFWKEAVNNTGLDEQAYLDAIRLNVDYLLDAFDRNAFPNGRGSWSSFYWVNDSSDRAGRPTWGRSLEPPGVGWFAERADEVLLKWHQMETDQARKDRIKAVLERFLLFWKYDAPPLNSQPEWVAAIQPYITGAIPAYDPAKVSTWTWWLWYNHNSSAIDRFGNAVPLYAFVAAGDDYDAYYGNDALAPEHNHDGHYPMMRSISSKLNNGLDSQDHAYLYDGSNPQHNHWLDYYFNQDTEAKLFGRSGGSPAWTAYAIGQMDSDGFFGTGSTVRNGKNYTTVTDNPFNWNVRYLAWGAANTPGAPRDSDGDGHYDSVEAAAGTDPYDSEAYPGHSWFCGDGACNPVDEDAWSCHADCGP